MKNNNLTFEITTNIHELYFNLLNNIAGAVDLSASDVRRCSSAPVYYFT